MLAVLVRVHEAARDLALGRNRREPSQMAGERGLGIALHEAHVRGRLKHALPSRGIRDAVGQPPQQCGYVLVELAVGDLAHVVVGLVPRFDLARGEQGQGARIMLGDHEETGALQARRYQLRAHGVAQPRVAGQRCQQSRRGMVLFRVRADAVLSGAQRVEKIEYGQCGLPVSHVQPPEE